MRCILTNFVVLICNYVVIATNFVVNICDNVVLVHAYYLILVLSSIFFFLKHSYALTNTTY